MTSQPKQDNERRQEAVVDGTSASSPVFYCPDDVLMCIFEVAVEETEDEFATATRISHVCNTWREVALRTPRLWEQVVVSFKKPIDVILAYLERTSNRVKLRPVFLSISQVDANNSGGPTLAELKISRFSLIHTLSLELYGDDSIHRQLMHDDIDYSDCKIQELLIYFHNSKQDQHTWHGYKLVARFPSVEGLTFYGEQSMLIERSDSNDFTNQMPQIRGLEFNYMAVPLLRTLWGFPHLETLCLKDVELYEDIFDFPSMLVLDQLHYIDISAADYVEDDFEWWLGHISTPNLTQFLVQDNKLSSRLPFIARHLSITSLERCPATVDAVSQLSEAAPQLTYLGLALLRDEDYSTALQALITSHFVHLQSLNIIIDVHTTLSLNMFEAIVTGRCLPSSHPKSQRPDAIELVRALTMTGDMVSSHAWMTSEFFISAKKTRGEADKDMTNVTLSWTEL